MFVGEALPANIRLGWRGFPGTNTLAYDENPKFTAVKSFIVQAPDQMIFKFRRGARKSVHAGNTKGGRITVPLTSCLTGMESAV